MPSTCTSCGSNRTTTWLPPGTVVVPTLKSFTRTSRHPTSKHVIMTTAKTRGKPLPRTHSIAAASFAREGLGPGRLGNVIVRERGIH